jgi:hypothetical protein
MGLRVPASDIDGTTKADGTALSDALVSVGPAGRGGTGAFVSSNGLIITNHHVALDAVRQASRPGSDYLKDGFVARSVDQEIAGPDYEVWITRSCVDVSDKLAESRAEPDPLKRANLIRNRRQELAREAEVGTTGPASSIRCEVQEMWPNRVYVLFTYERLRDVRIVYVPPMTLGCFGGDTDNFEWPRHTADFTLLRAYVARDGSAAAPSSDNVPYQPRKFLRASKSGAKPGDFVFLLGFPGQTMRYAPTSRLLYSQEVAVPADLSDFGAKLHLIKMHATDRAAALKLAAAKKSLANEYKRSKGKIVMMRKLGLIAERQAEETALIAAAPEAKAALSRLSAIYGELRTHAAVSDALDTMRGIYHGSTLLAVGHAIHEGRAEAAKPDAERESEFRARNLPFLIKRLSKRLKDLHPPHEAALLRRAVAVCTAAKVETSTPLDASALEAAAAALERGAIGEVGPVATLTPEELQSVLSGTSAPPEDVFVSTASRLYAAFCQDRDRSKALLSERDQLLAQLLELQQSSAPAGGQTFYPDANGCLRLSAGHVEGYKAADAVMHSPVTTLAGLVDKHLEAALSGDGRADDEDEEFACPARLLEACRSDATIAQTPVCICYSTDTVGGNSGSPVLDADGNFVAINFDRQRLGLMNEFKWSIDFSRSIGTDVRYILWLVGEYDQAQWLVDEMVK